MAFVSPERKAYGLSILFTVFFVLLGVYLFRLQILDGKIYRNLSEKNRVRVIYLEAPRGRILDRSGDVLATSRLSFNCSAFPFESKANIYQTLQTLSILLSEDVETLQKRYARGKPGIYNTIVLAQDIPAEQAVAIEERLDSLPGILIETRPVREYPHKESAAHLSGYIGPMTDEEEENLEDTDYLPSDWIGRDGVEKFYESSLHGRAGGLQMEVNSRGRFVRALGVKEPDDGKDVQLTVDARLQEFVQKEIGTQIGSVIVMDLKDGGILAMNSAPSFDPNLFASVAGRRNLSPVLTDPAAPLLNRGIRSQYPAGSIFKIVTALAALTSSRLTEFSTFNCNGAMIIGGNTFHCWRDGGHGSQGMAEAFAHSCDVYFYSAGLLAGVDAIDRVAVEFGFSHTTGVDLPYERPGLLPSKEWKRKKLNAGWYEGDTANLSIGQGALQITPMQALQMIAATAKNGLRTKPHVVDKIDGVKVPEENLPPVNKSAKQWKSVKQGLHDVVNTDTGTGRLSRVMGLSIAGKTGTAQSGQDKNHAWFVGYSPEKDPKIAMVVFLEQGGHGGIEAAGLASKIFKQLKELSYL